MLRRLVAIILALTLGVPVMVMGADDAVAFKEPIDDVGRTLLQRFPQDVPTSG